MDSKPDRDSLSYNTVSNVAAELENKNSVDMANLSVGSVLSSSGRILRQKFGLVLALAAIAFGPIVVLYILLPIYSSLAMTLIIVLYIFVLLQAQVIYVVFESLNGREPTLFETLAHSFRRCISVSVAMLLVFLGTAVGVALLVIPGIILSCMWSVTLPACILERAGPFKSLARSSFLTKGVRRQIFVILLIVLVTTNYIPEGIEWLLAKVQIEGLLFIDFLGPLFYLAGLIFTSAVYSVLYFNLRIIKEGMIPDNAIEVFN